MPSQLASLICGSPNRNHDFDFARLRLAQALYDATGIRTDCFQDYEDSAAILGNDLLVSYTSQVPVSDPAAYALRRFLQRGGRWFALHASNSVLGNQLMPRILGTRFITHPRYMEFEIEVTKPAEPLLEGLPARFTLPDELYVIEDVTQDIEVLLHANWGGEGFGGHSFAFGPKPLMYRRKVGEGGILYLALGHANRPYDKPFHDYPDQPDYRGPWDDAVFRTLVARGIEWAAGRRPF